MTEPYVVVHSKTKPAWNIVGTVIAENFKVARFPYVECGDEILDTEGKAAALDRAKFCAKCLNARRRGLTDRTS